MLLSDGGAEFPMVPRQRRFVFGAWDTQIRLVRTAARFLRDGRAEFR